MRITLEISSIPIQLQFILEYQELMEHLHVKEMPMLQKMRYIYPLGQEGSIRKLCSIPERPQFYEFEAPRASLL